VLFRTLIGFVLTVGLPISVATDSEPLMPVTIQAAPAGLQDGDLVFRRGRDAIGRIVLSHGDQPRFSHVGMIVRVEDQPLVVHALPQTAGHAGGVRLESVEAFSSPMRASDAGYYRLQRLMPDQRLVIRRYLLEAVGMPFDLRFEYTSDDALYCTELVLKALAAAGVDLTRSLGTVRVALLDEPVIAPDELWRSRQLKELVAIAQGAPVATRAEGVGHEL
jgi:hypothetical protein